MRHFFLLLALSAAATAHDEYMGSCPRFEPMTNFDWDEFSEGRWYAMEKFDTSSKCFTYDFGEDEDGFKFVDQTRVLRDLKRFSVDNKYHYKGRIAVPNESNPANMQVRFPLSRMTHDLLARPLLRKALQFAGITSRELMDRLDILGPASFVVLDTDYNSYALLCTCQQKDFLFLTFHRRSCTILQREPVPDADISRRMHDLLNEQIGDPTDDEQPDHDFDAVDHSNCNYADDGKGLQIDVDKILGATKDEVETTLTRAVDELAGGIFDDHDDDEDRERVVNLPLKDKEDNPRI